MHEQEQGPFIMQRVIPTLVGSLCTSKRMIPTLVGSLCMSKNKAIYHAESDSYYGGKPVHE